MNSAPALWRERLSRGSVNAALLLMAMDLGGSFYEHLGVGLIRKNRHGVA